MALVSTRARRITARFTAYIVSCVGLVLPVEVCGVLGLFILKGFLFFFSPNLELSCLSFFPVSHLTSFPSDDDNPLWSRTPPTRRPSLNDYPHFPNAAL